MERRLVYDLPTRLFHWLFSGLFLVAFYIAKTTDNESVVFSYHMLAGLTLGFLILIRLLWGVFGTKHARFTYFALNPKSFFEYFKGILSGDKRKWAGHNPASSWAAIVMLAVGLGLVFSGFMMATGNKEAFEDLHDILANTFLVVAILHVSGIAIHSLRHRDGIALSMVTGRKQDVEIENEIKSSRPLLALLFLALVLAFAIQLNRNFNPQSRALQLFGVTLQLGENEENEGSEEKQLEKKEQGEKGGEREQEDGEDE